MCGRIRKQAWTSVLLAAGIFVSTWIILRLLRPITVEMAESTLKIGFWNWKFVNSVLADLVSYVHRFFVGVEKERQKSSDDLLEGVVLEDSPR